MAGEEGHSFLMVSGVVVQEDTAVPEVQEAKAVVMVDQHRTRAASKQCPVAVQTFLK